MISHVLAAGVKEAAQEGREKAEELLAEPSTGNAVHTDHRSLWHKLFSNGRCDSIEMQDLKPEMAGQPILNPDEFRQYRMAQKTEERLIRYQQEELTRYVANLSNIAITNNDQDGVYCVEFKLGVDFQDFCVRTSGIKTGNSNDKHIAITSNTRSDSCEKVCTPWAHIRAGNTAECSMTWRSDWRGSQRSLRKECLEIIIWQRDWGILNSVLGRTKIALEDIAMGENEQIATVTTGADKSFVVSFRLDFSELYNFNVVVASASISLAECPMALSTYESFRLILSTDKGKGSFPLTDGEWLPNKTATIHTSNALTHLQFDQPGNLLWRGMSSSFADLDLTIEIQGKPRVGDWTRYAMAEIPTFYLFNAQVENFNRRAMLCALPPDRPLLSCTLALPHKPELQQSHVAMQRGQAPSALRVKVKGISGLDLASKRYVFSTSLGSRVPEPDGASIQTFADITRAAQLPLLGIPSTLFEPKGKSTHTNRKKTSSLENDVSPLLVDSSPGHTDSQATLAFDNWIQQRLVIVYLWVSESTLDSVEAERELRQPHGFCILRMADIVSNILNQALKAGDGRKAVAEFTTQLLAYGPSWRKSGIEITLSISMDPLPRCGALPTRTAIALKRALPSVLPPFVFPDQLGQPLSLFKMLELKTLPATLAPYEVGRSIRLISRNTNWIADPLLCLYEGAGSQADIAVVVASLMIFRGDRSYLGQGKSIEDRPLWFTLEERSDGSLWWWYPGAWCVEVTNAPQPAKTLPALFPGSLKFVDTPSFLANVVFLLNGDRGYRGWSHNLLNFYEEFKGADELLDVVTADAVENMLIHQKADPLINSKFQHLPSAPSSLGETQLAELQRRVATSLNHRLQTVFNMTRVDTVSEVLEMLLESYTQNNIEKAESIIEQLRESKLGSEVNIATFEAPTVSIHYWNKLLQSELEAKPANRYGLAIQITPCNLGCRVLTRVVLVLLSQSKEPVNKYWTQVNVENCPSLRPTGNPDQDAKLLKEFVGQIAA